MQRSNDAPSFEYTHKRTAMTGVPSFRFGVGESKSLSQSAKNKTKQKRNSKCWSGVTIISVRNSIKGRRKEWVCGIKCIHFIRWFMTVFLPFRLQFFFQISLECLPTAWSMDNQPWSRLEIGSMDRRIYDYTYSFLALFPNDCENFEGD